MITEYLGPPYLESLVGLCGYPVYDRVVQIELHGPKIGNSIAAIAGEFPYLRVIELQDTSVTEDWLDRFREDHPDCEIRSEIATSAKNAG